MTAHGSDAGPKPFEFAKLVRLPIDYCVFQHFVLFERGNDRRRIAALMIHIGFDPTSTHGKRFIKRRDGFLRGLLAVFWPNAESAQIGKRHHRNFARAIRGAIHRSIVHQDQLAVLGLANVHFHVIATEIGGFAQGR